MFKDVRQGANKALGKNAWILNAFLIVLVIIVAVKIFKSLKLGAQSIGDTLGNEALSMQTGIATVRVASIRATAKNLWDNAVTRNWYVLLLVRDYDEDKFIDAINGMGNTKEVAMLDEFYKENAGETLGDVISKAFDNTDRTRLQTEYLTLLQS